MHRRIPLLLAAVMAALCHTAAAQVPQIINYQGRINVGSSPFTGTGQFRFALVNGDGSTSFWSNDGTSTAGSQPTAAVSLPVANGLYVVPLGDTAIPNMQAVPATVFTNNDVRLRVWFNDGTNGSQLLAPDQRITSVGYAMVAGTVPDGAITSTKIAAGAVGASNLTPDIAIDGTVTGPISWSQLNGVPAGLADGVDDIGVSSITAGSGLVGGTITSDGTIGLSSDIPRLGAGANNFMGALSAGVFSGDGSGLSNLSGSALQDGSVPLTAMQSAARPKHDLQMAAVTATNPMLTTTIADIPGISLTTKNLGENGVYRLEYNATLIWLSAGSGGWIYTVLNVDGTDLPETAAYSMINASSQNFLPISKSVVATNLSSGKIVKLRANYNGGLSNVQLFRPVIIIDGVPTSQVVP